MQHLRHGELSRSARGRDRLHELLSRPTRGLPADLKGIGFTLCLPPKTWNTSSVTYRYTTNLPAAPIELAVEFFVDKNGNNKPDSGELEGWYNSTATAQIHDFNDARGVEIGTSDCPQHVDFWVDTLP